MYYVQRNDEGQLIRVENAPFSGMTGEVFAETAEISAWKNAGSVVDESMHHRELLQKSDLEMVRVLDDLIFLLIQKGVITITDLPEMAQVKLMNRAQARQGLGGLEGLLNSDDQGIF
ncbi:tryptophan synthase subunit beta [Buttiauxella selenatireducens]|uniref:Tryptophan synthase subunit beta n=1 Tax=Buttiauxella selenatireducens TaxID=3073902 RepID=A0ABY9SCA2_9ENTR|nr:tryptophan synthase subunit beta [Buttiauxella sp. R73]WMY75134.1 tryptophan synthase subunit beta [Buttiauxella sp. R73]